MSGQKVRVIDPVTQKETEKDFSEISPVFTNFTLNVIAPGATTVVYTRAHADFIGSYMTVASWNVTESKTEMHNYNLIKQGSNYDDTIFGQVGKIKKSIDAIQNGANIEVQITNNETFAITVKTIFTDIN